MMDLNQFQSWQQEKPETRVVKIEIDPEGTSIFVWDRKLGMGQIVHSVDEINLEDKAEEAERKKFAELQAKYGGQVAAQLPA